MIDPTKLGYACINIELQATKIKTSRTIRKKNFLKDTDLKLVSELTTQNLKDLREIIKWNNNNGIKFYRISSNIMPWWSEYQLTNLPDYKKIVKILQDIGSIATNGGQRLTFHPGHFTILASKNPKVVNLAIKELEQHSLVFDLMGFQPSHWNKLNIHVGTAQDGLIETASRFIKNFNRLSDNCKQRITLENDDKVKMWSIKNLYDLIYKYTKIPIVFDVHHHRVGAQSNLSESEALALAVNTWKNIPPIIHFSSSKKIFESNEVREVAHADFIHEKIDTYGHKNLWVMLEAKMKEKALLKYRKIF